MKKDSEIILIHEARNDVLNTTWLTVCCSLEYLRFQSFHPISEKTLRKNDDSLNTYNLKLKYLLYTQVFLAQ